MKENHLLANRSWSFKDILLFPSKNLIYVIPSTVLFGLVWGYFVDTSSLQAFILPTVVLMVYPSMIGFNLRDEKVARPIYGEEKKYRDDPHFKDLIQFYEYYHGDTCKGLGASHQTGWTALVAEMIQWCWCD